MTFRLHSVAPRTSWHQRAGTDYSRYIDVPSRARRRVKNSYVARRLNADSELRWIIRIISCRSWQILVISYLREKFIDFPLYRRLFFVFEQSNDWYQKSRNWDLVHPSLDRRKIRKRIFYLASTKKRKEKNNLGILAALRRRRTFQFSRRYIV